MEIKIMMLFIVLTVLACFVHWLGCRLTAMLFCDSKHHMKRVACHLFGALLNFVVAYLSLFILVTCHMDGNVVFPVVGFCPRQFLGNVNWCVLQHYFVYVLDFEVL